uniref:Resolvase/invertase-type recombinase catalytic domain-containing protein n=1 Tax=viral metagenome TaxID=1070528 RepID=A0A6C0CFL9_9ZZZZ
MKNSGCAYGYVRVSTTKQVQEGSSLEEQEKKIRAWAELHSMDLKDVFVDKGVSGTFMFNRPEFGKLIACMDKGDILVANDLSRVSRNSADTAQLIEMLHKMEAYAVFIKDGMDTSTMMGQSMVQMASIMKGIEANYTAERVKDTLASMRENGQNTGRPPYGWTRANQDRGSHLIEVPEQQAIVASIKKMSKEDGLSYREIARRLTKDNIPSPGKLARWNDKSVKLIVCREEVATGGRLTPK